MPLTFKQKLTTCLNRFDAKFSIADKIGFGYVVAISLGFTGTMTGLLFADYWQGQGVEQFVDAQQQAHLLERFQVSARDVQMSGLRLAAAVNDADKVQAERQQLRTSLRTVEITEQELEQFLASDPVWVAADASMMQRFLRQYLVRLEDYVIQVEGISERLPLETAASDNSTTITATANGASQVQRELLTLAQTDRFITLDRLHQELLGILQIAQLQEEQGGENMETAQGWEKLIIVLSAIGSVTIAGAIALRTTKGIVRPLEDVQQTIDDVIQNADFSLRLKVEHDDEVGFLAKSFNQLIQWVNEYTQELTQTLDNLKQTQAQLIQTEKMSSLGQMVAGIAHEINNPVNFISGNLSCASDYLEDLLYVQKLYQQHIPNPPPEVADAIAEVDLDYVQKDYPRLLDSMKIGTRRICEIVVSLRNFSRVDQSDRKMVDVHEGIDSTLLLLQHRLKARPEHPAIAIHKNYGDLPPVPCYSGQLNQVFMNLLANAIDATEDARLAHNKESGRSTDTANSSLEPYAAQISIHTAVRDQTWAEIAIADNGLGIPDALQTKIFDPFFTTKPAGKGTGLGLSISYQIITDLHNGKLACQSSPEQGTRFVIQIPLHQPEPPSELVVSSPNDVNSTDATPDDAS